ncbi:hypothetical protein ACGFZB_28780 [Streptomyces cinerochromogenes]|uniref:Uncharacterized protein n=1 Tax=Streptomyces cinerochromogenes TaxID=66422 RepID=A0ABW7BF74_9ACTN
MSRINIYETTTGNSRLEINLPSLQRGQEDHCFTDGEELMAASAVIELVNHLDNGEALVITRDVF